MTIAIGLAGFGHWGPNLARNLAAGNAIRLTAIADRAAARRAAAAEAYPTARLYAEAADLAADPALDAIAIATPAASHFALAMAALAAGKHLLVEKPLCLTLGDLEALLAAAQSHKRVLMVDHLLLCMPAFARLRDQLADGSIGPLRRIACRRENWGRFATDANVIWDLAAHDIAMLDALLGEEPARVLVTESEVGESGGCDRVCLSLDFPSGCHAEIVASRLSREKRRVVRLEGERGALLWDELDLAGKLRQMPTGQVLSGLPQGEPLQILVARFAAAIGGAQDQLCDRGHLRRTIATLLRAQRSLDRRQAA